MIWLTSTSTNINHENHPPNQSTISPQTSTNQPFLDPSNQPSYPIQVIQVALCKRWLVGPAMWKVWQEWFTGTLSWAQKRVAAHKISRNLPAATQWPITCHSYYSFWVCLEVEEKGKKQVVDSSSAKSIGLYGGFHTPKWMVYNGMRWMIWGYPSFRKPPYYSYIISSLLILKETPCQGAPLHPTCSDAPRQPFYKVPPGHKRCGKTNKHQ